MLALQDACVLSHRHFLCYLGHGYAHCTHMYITFKLDHEQLPRSSTGPLAAGVTLAGALPGNEPGGERQIAARVKQQGQRASVKLGNEHVGFGVPSWPGTPRDLSEKERNPCASHTCPCTALAVCTCFVCA
jgi:hypothetical protein